MTVSEVLEKELNKNQCEAISTFTSVWNTYSGFSNVFQYYPALLQPWIILEMPTFGIQRAHWHNIVWYNKYLRESASQWIYNYVPKTLSKE